MRGKTFRANLYGKDEKFHVVTAFVDCDRMVVLKSWWPTIQKWNYSVWTLQGLELHDVNIRKLKELN